MAHLAKMVSVCRLCGSSVAYSNRRVALFCKTANKERLACSGLLNLKCKWKVESLETAMILTSILYRVRTLTSHNTEESENSPSPHILKRLNACANSVYQELLRFSRTMINCKCRMIVTIRRKSRVCDITIIIVQDL